MPPSIETLLLSCQTASKQAGALLLELESSAEVREKSPADLVTSADIASQQLVQKYLADTFPGHVFLGEEQSSSVADNMIFSLDQREDWEYCWVLDPIDGTINYAHHVPHYAVSLAVCNREHWLAGVIFNPRTGEMYYATRHGGAFLKNQLLSRKAEKLSTSSVKRLKNSLAAVGLPPMANEKSPDLQVFVQAVCRTQAIRRTGSAALNLAYLAAGRFDIFWSFSTHLWDVAAGLLLLQEAGGSLSKIDGTALRLQDSHFLAAANDELLEELKELVGKVQ